MLPRPKIEPKPKTVPIKRDKQAFAATLRENATASELELQKRLNELNFEFEFQSVVGAYIPDFYFPKARKIVELDGACHNNRREYDKRRDAQFKKQGIATLRIKSHRVFTDLTRVMAEIARFVSNSSKPLRKQTKKQKKRIKQKLQAFYTRA